MKELLYFSSSDLMVQVFYEKEANTLNYYSHRKLSFSERIIVEQYLLTNVAVKTEYYKKHPSSFSYVGIDTKLVKELNHYHLKNTMKQLKKKEEELDASVKTLIGQSMESYYFEQIGNTILEMKQMVHRDLQDHDLGSCGRKLKELLQAYNQYANRSVSFEEILPDELQSYFDYS